MTTLVLAPLIARALAKVAQDAGLGMPPVPMPMPPVPMPAAPIPTAPAMPATKPLIQSQMPKTEAAQAEPSAVVPDFNHDWQEHLADQWTLNPAELVKSPQYQKVYEAYKKGLGDSLPMTPEEYLPEAQKTAIDTLRTTQKGRYAGLRMRPGWSGKLTPDEQLDEQLELRANLPFDQFDAFNEQEARGLLGNKAYDMWMRRAAAGRPLPAEGFSKLDLKHPFNNDLSTWWGAAKDVATIGGHKAVDTLFGSQEPDDMEDLRTAQEMQGQPGGEDMLPAVNRALAAKQNPMQFIAQQKADKAADAAAPLLAKPETDPSMMDQLKQGAQAFFSEPRNWLVPLGGLLMLFGGKTSKILGTLAMAGGAADLYGRYQGIKSMGETPEGQAAYKLAVTAKDAKGQPAPFSNLPELITKFPEQAQALKDTNTLFAMGLRNQFDKQVAAKAVRAMTGMGVTPAVALATLERRKLIDQQTAKDMRESMAADTAASAERLKAVGK